jgi:plastocyanin
VVRFLLPPVEKRARLMSRYVRAWIIAAVAWLTVSGPATGSYREMGVTDGGRIAGRVRLAGDVTPLPPQPVFKERAYCGDTMPDERLVTDADRDLAGAVVYLVGVEAGKAVPRVPVTFENRKCAFVPHVLVASVGQTVEMRNEDPFLHDAHALLGPRTLFNLAILKGRTVRRELTDPGIVHVNCNLRHTWMHAYIFVTEGPYRTVTDTRGRYTLDDVPPGTYTLAVWHELLGDHERQVTIPQAQELSVDFDLQAVAPESQ